MRSISMTFEWVFWSHGSPALLSPVWTSSSLNLTPRFILTFWSSLWSLVLWRRIACLMGPSPAWIPFEKRTSCTSTRAKFEEVSFLRSSIINLALPIISSSTGLSTIQVQQIMTTTCWWILLTFQSLNHKSRCSLPVLLSNSWNKTFNRALLGIEAVEDLSGSKIEIHDNILGYWLQMQIDEWWWWERTMEDCWKKFEALLTSKDEVTGKQWGESSAR